MQVKISAGLNIHRSNSEQNSVKCLCSPSVLYNNNREMRLKVCDAGQKPSLCTAHSDNRTHTHTHMPEEERAALTSAHTHTHRSSCPAVGGQGQGQCRSVCVCVCDEWKCVQCVLCVVCSSCWGTYA